jgi:hypothetical protein
MPLQLQASYELFENRVHIGMIDILAEFQVGRGKVELIMRQLWLN